MTQGLPALRRQWILDRADVEEHDGREVKPEDNGYLSEAHSEKYNQLKNAKNRLKEYPGLKRKPLRAKGSSGGEGNWHPVTQKWYADQGIITQEMEYVAIRENLGRQEEFKTIADKYPNLRDLPPEASDRIRQLCSTPEGYEMPRPSEVDPNAQVARNRIDHQHPGQSWGAMTPAFITAEYVRSEVARGRGDHSCECQPSRKRTDDYRTEFSGQD